MSNFRYRYSVRFLNEQEQDWFEKEATQTLEEAREVKNNLETSGRKTKIFDLQDGSEIE